MGFHPLGPTDEPQAPSPAGSKKPKSVTSKKAKDKDDVEADVLRMRSELVHRILEGLRGDAFMVARDLGLDKLTQEHGISWMPSRKWFFQEHLKKQGSCFV